MRDILSEIKSIIPTIQEVKSPVKIGYAPEGKKACIYIYFVPGDDAKYHFGRQEKTISKPKVCIKVRHPEYAQGYIEAEAIKKRFSAGKVDDTFGMFLDGDINYLGYEENECPEFELNYKTIIVN